MQNGVHHPFPSVLPDDQMSIAASEGVFSPSGDDDSAALPPSGVVALSEPDPEMTAMLSRAAENVGLVWNPPPRSDPSRLDEWFLGGGRAENAPCPRTRCHSSWRCMRSSQGRGIHLSLPKNKSCSSPPPPPPTTLDSGVAVGYAGIPSVERSVAMQLCPTAATTLRGDACPPPPPPPPIWDRFSTGSMAESRGGRGNAVHTGFILHRPAAEPSAREQIPRSFGQECPWSRYPGMLWYSRMPRQLAGEPRKMGTQYQGYRRVPSCIRISIVNKLAIVAYILQQGGLWFRRMSQLACHLLLWSQKHLRSLHAILHAIHAKTGLCAEVEPVCRIVFLSPWEHPEMFDQSLCCQSSWSFSLWKPYSWLHWPQSIVWGSFSYTRSG